MNLKQMQEEYNAYVESLEKITNKAKDENRTLNDEERKTFDETLAKAKALKSDIARVQEMDNIGLIKSPNEGAKNAKTPEEIYQEDVKKFAAYIRENLKGNSQQADTNITRGDNGSIIPTTIVNKIIDHVKELSPLFADCETYSGKGKLVIPYVDDAKDAIAVSWANEFEDLVATGTGLKTMELDEYLAGVLTKVSKSLVNNTDIDIVNFVTSRMAQALAVFFEKCILGQDTKVDGIKNATNVITAKSTTAITLDEIMNLMDEIPTVYQQGAYFLCNKKTLTVLRQLKDKEGRYLLNNDVRTGFGKTLLGTEVKTSDWMPKIGDTGAVLVYVNPQVALAKHITENFELGRLNEKYALQHAVGFYGYVEFDCKIQNQEGIAVMKMATA